jgi:hypothetical protein
MELGLLLPVIQDLSKLNHVAMNVVDWANLIDKMVRA